VASETAGKRVRQTKRRFNYQPGKGQLIFMTGKLGAGAAGITREIGYGDDANGLFFRLADSTLSVVRRSSASGQVVEEVVPQSAWNINKADGSGFSGTQWNPTYEQSLTALKINTAMEQIFVIDFEWLGVGGVRFGFVIDRVLYYVHEMNHANKLDVVYMSTPNLPCRYSIENDGTGAAAELEHVCTSVQSEGGQEDTGAIFSASNGNTQVDANVAGTVYAAIGLRLKTTHIGATVIKLAMSMLGSTQNDYFLWQLIFNPTIAGTFTYAPLTNSACEIAYGATANTITGGVIVNSGYGTQRASISDLLQDTLTLGSKIDGTRDTIVLTVMPVAGASNLDIYASITWRELA
jgi:hypothetical protein